MGESHPAAPTSSDAGERRPHIYCVGGGKGGTGKSILSLNLAALLSQEGMQVVLADMDLGGANLHLLTGIRRCESTIRDFFGGRVRELDELLVKVDDLGLRLLPGGDEVAGVVQPGHQRKLKLIRHMRRLPADVIVCDLGGNCGLDTLDLFNEADWGLVVVTPEPTAIQNAYGFVKAALLRKVVRRCKRGTVERELLDRLWSPADESVRLSIPEFISAARSQDQHAADTIDDVVHSSRFSVVVNQADAEEGERVHKTLAAVAQKFLDVELTYLGHVPSDGRIHEAVVHGKAPLLGKSAFASRVWEHVNIQLEPTLAVGINEEVHVRDEILHIQTEDLGPAAGAYHTLVYAGGTILLTKRVEYDSSFFERATSVLKQDRVRFLHRTVIQAILSGRIRIQLPGERTGERSDEGGEGEADHAAGHDRT